MSKKFFFMRRNFMNLVIFGAGYVGLTTGVCLAERGNNVI